MERKCYLKIEKGVIVAVAESFRKGWQDSPYELITSKGLPVALFTDNWQRKTAEELAALGLDEHGKPLPTPEELAAQAAKKQAEEQALALQHKAQLNQQFIAAQRSAVLEELLADRLAQQDNYETIQRAEQRAVFYQAEAQVLLQKNQTEDV